MLKTFHRKATNVFDPADNLINNEGDLHVTTLYTGSVFDAFMLKPDCFSLPVLVLKFSFFKYICQQAL